MRALAIMAACCVAAAATPPPHQQHHQPPAPPLQPLRRVTVPVRLNVVLVGFESALADQALLAPYLEDVETRLPHAFVDGGASDAVEYAYAVHVVPLSHTVTKLFEAVISTFVRADNATASGAHYQVDVDRILPVAESLVHRLGLHDAYTLLLLNCPKGLRADLRYGYRAGFSADELRQIATSDDLRKIVLQINTAADKNRPGGPGGPGDAGGMPAHDEDAEAALPDEASRPLPRGPGVVFEDMVAQADAWARAFLAETRQLLARQDAPGNVPAEDCARPMTVLLQDPDGDHSHAVNMKPALTLAEAAEAAIAVGHPSDAAALRLAAQGGVVHAGCVVGSWVGHGRTAFIDLAAGPFSWGTTATGKGALVDTAAVYPGARDTVAQATRRYRTRALLQAGDTDDDTFDDGGASADAGRSRSIDAELRIYEAFLARNCDPENLPQGEAGQRLTRACEETRVRMARLEARRAERPVAPGGGLLSDVVEEEEAPAGAADADAPERYPPAAYEEFGARLGSVISRTLRTLVTPPTARSSLDLRGLAKRVSFRVVVVTNHHKAYRHLGAAAGGFDYDLFRTEMDKLCLPGHAFAYTLQEVALTDESRLAMVYWDALHTAVTGAGGQGTRMYLDSEHLHRQLLDDDGVTEASVTPNGLLSRVLVFIFVVDYELPVLIDLYQQAAVIDNAVVAVQHGLQTFRTRDQCNGQPVAVSLRNPTKAVIAAAAEIVGGLAAPRDRLWSVGAAPLQATSPRARHGAFDVDTAHRHWLTVRMDRIKGALDTVLARLRGETSVHVAREVETLRATYSEVVRVLEAVGDHAALMDYRTVFRLLSTAEDDVRVLFNVTAAMGAVQHEAHCRHEVDPDEQAAQTVRLLTTILTLGLVNAVLLLVYYLCTYAGPLPAAVRATMPEVLRPSKVKIN